MSEDSRRDIRAEESAAERLLAEFGYAARSSGDPDASPEVPAMRAAIDTPEATSAAVRRLLAAAAAPARPHELRGYAAVRRAFEDAAPRARGRHAMSLPMARIAGVKIAALAGALTVAGVAVAAEADVLPSPLQRVAHQVFGGVGVPDPDPGENHMPPTASSGRPSTAGGERPGTTTGPGATGSHTHGSTGANGGPGDSPTVSSSIPGASQTSAAADKALDLCRAYEAAKSGAGTFPAGQRRKLADLAGGDAGIDAFCARVLAAQPPTPAPSAAAPTPTSDATKVRPTHTADPSSGASTNPKDKWVPDSRTSTPAKR